MTTKSTRRVSERREIMELPDADGAVGYVGVFVDGIQIAAGVHQNDASAERNGGRRWSLWSSGLSMRLSSDAPHTFTHGGKAPLNAHTLAVRDEHDARAWLDLLADLAEHGPKIIETRRGIK